MTNAAKIAMIQRTLDEGGLSDANAARLRDTLDGLIASEAAKTLHMMPTPQNVEVGADEFMTPVAAVESVIATIERKPTPEERIAKENARRASKGRAKMTAEEARTFAMYSERNAAIVEEACEDGCTAYVDWFTFNRWIAQGRVVARGQKATKITVYNVVEKRDDATGEVRKIRTAREVPVFCRCQTKKLEAKGRAA